MLCTSLRVHAALRALTAAGSAAWLVGGAALATTPAATPAATTAAAPRADFQATVLSVGDGDTLRVSRGGVPLTLRLACIDAPEMSQAPHGAASRSYLLSRLPRGRQVTVHPTTTDRYGRTVAEVISELNINLVMVEDGQAFAYRKHLHQCDRQAYLEAEYRASRHRYGVWQVEGGITRPWDFRHGHRAVAIPDGTTPGGRR
jgi:endonuclease YncB( thermonuclease family)